MLELLPHPGLDDLEALVGDVRAAGLDVRLQVHGEPVALPPGLDLSAYRIVQEGLTNTLKHAGRTPGRGGRAATSPTSCGSRCATTGRAAPRPTTGLGHGLVGIRERVKIYGGDMSACVAACRRLRAPRALPLDGGAS